MILGRGVEIKTPEQLRLMRRAGLVVARAHAAVKEAARAGVTTGELDAVARDVLAQAGAQSSFLNYGAQYGHPPYPAVACISVNDEIVHGIPGSRVLSEGDVVSIDCGAEVKGWNGDAAFTAVVGGREAANQADLDLIDATEASLWAGIAAMTVGGRLFAVGDAVEASIRASESRDGRSYGVIEDYVGHGIGRQMHMDPQIPNYAVQDRGPIIVDGFTAAIEPMVTLGTIESDVNDDEWTVVTADGSRACHWEHSVAVREQGLWVLTAIDGGEAGLAGTSAAYAPLA